MNELKKYILNNWISFQFAIKIWNSKKLLRLTNTFDEPGSAESKKIYI